jgi:hypothetical protein
MNVVCCVTSSLGSDSVMLQLACLAERVGTNIEERRLIGTV